MTCHASWRFDNTIGLPAASQYAVLYRSDASFESAAYAPSAAVPTPGKSNGRMEGLRLTGAVTPAGQGITLQFYIRVAHGGTNADWALDTTAENTGGTGALAVAAGATQTLSYAPNAPDCMILALAGATPPTSIEAPMQLVPAGRS